MRYFVDIDWIKKKYFYWNKYIKKFLNYLFWYLFLFIKHNLQALYILFFRFFRYFALVCSNNTHNIFYNYKNRFSSYWCDYNTHDIFLYKHDLILLVQNTAYIHINKNFMIFYHICYISFSYIVSIHSN